MTERTVTTARALHARPASQIVKSAARFEAEVRLLLGETAADTRSVLSLMRLGLAAGVPVTVQATGAEAEAALEAVVHELTSPEPVGEDQPERSETP
jgi:phosphotransferase system HPr (HPr) family protein